MTFAVTCLDCGKRVQNCETDRDFQYVRRAHLRWRCAARAQIEALSEFMSKIEREQMSAAIDDHYEGHAPVSGGYVPAMRDCRADCCVDAVRRHPLLQLMADESNIEALT